MKRYMVEYQGYTEPEYFETLEEAMKEADACVNVEYEAHLDGSEHFEWDENVVGAVKVYYKDDLISLSDLVNIKNSLSFSLEMVSYETN